ncbi:hypothetical protein VTN00DRAFT_1606 [Thermoascus crustaceus]|uniref:uncharacterized protein n=1 Tax=Thermoascus crustaceus TaxID=5088 RepID=UPI00374235C1
MPPPRRRPPRPGALSDLSPLKIMKKIVLLQLAYYASATVLILFATLAAGMPFDMDLIFGWDSIRGDTTIGYILALVWLLNGFVSVIYHLLLISRSKLIPDFACTLHFIHLCVTWLYTHSLPANWLWWGLQAASAALMTFLGIWACQWRELQPISFGLGGSSAAGAGSNAAGESSQSQQQQGQGDGNAEDGLAGFPSRGRGRTRNLRDSGGEYEMVRMKEGDEPV